MFTKNDPADIEECNGRGMWQVWGGDRIGACRVLVVKPEGKRPLGRPGRKRETYQYGSARNRLGRLGLDFSSSGQGRMAGCCESGNNYAVRINCWEFPD
jgi:hypothetical protein